MESIESVLRGLETGDVDEWGLPAGLQGIDRKLAKAMLLDARALLAALLSWFGGLPTPGAHGYRVRQILTCLGWVGVKYAYVRKAGSSPLLEALGATQRCTQAAREAVARCAALCGSFAEGCRMLAFLAGMQLGTSKFRAMALEYGEQCLRAQDEAVQDVRTYADKELDEGERKVPHTFFCMLDGSGVPCTPKDTAGSKGKDGDAGTRQIRVIVMGEYDKVDAKGRPVPIKKSFSYAVCAKEIKDAASLLRDLAVARGCGAADRIQCLADGEEALEIAMRDVLRDAVFTNDYIHACEHLHQCCLNLSQSPQDAQKEFRFARGLLFRIGAAAAVKRIETKYPSQLESSEIARKQLHYLRKRQANMQFGKLRREGFLIATGHVEAGVRIVVARRCKQAGMHWRLLNATRICAILAHLRSIA
jgi:hypothetical protein